MRQGKCQVIKNENALDQQRILDRPSYNTNQLQTVPIETFRTYLKVADNRRYFEINIKKLLWVALCINKNLKNHLKCQND